MPLSLRIRGSLFTIEQNSLAYPIYNNMIWCWYEIAAAANWYQRKELLFFRSA